MGNLSGGKMLRKRQRAADLIGRLVLFMPPAKATPIFTGHPPPVTPFCSRIMSYFIELYHICIIM